MIMRAGCATLLFALVTTASSQLDIDFEADVYATGNLAGVPAGSLGQDSWYFAAIPTSGVKLVQVIDSDNGPSAAGSQCLQITADTAAYPGGQIRVHRRFDDVVPEGGGLVVFQYDFKWVNALDEAVPLASFRPRVLDQANGDSGVTGLSMSHDSVMQFHFYGSDEPDGSSVGFLQNPLYDVTLPRADAAEWNTITWVAYYGGDLDGDYGQLLYGEINGVRTPWLRQFMPSNVHAADLLQLRILPTGADASVYRVDNIQIYGMPLGAAPTADAGADQFDVPATYGGAAITLDASASTDADGTIDYYVWTLVSEPPETVVARGVATQYAAPANSSGEVRLTVIDNDGVQSCDTLAYSTATPISVPIENLACPFAVKNGDIFGSSRADTVLPEGQLAFEIVTQRIGDADGFAAAPLNDFQFVFDEFGGMYRLTWQYRLVKLSPNFELCWQTAPLTGIELATSAIMVGQRCVYVVAGAGGAVPNVYAFDRVSGQQIWRIELTHEGTTASTNTRPLATLLDNKIYYVGPPSGSGENRVARVWRVDCGTDTDPETPLAPSIDWVSSVQWSASSMPYGNLTAIPADDGTDAVTLVFAGRGASATDDLPEVVGMKYDPTTETFTKWGLNGPRAVESSVIFSAAADRAFVLTDPASWDGYGAWTVDPETGEGVGLKTWRASTAMSAIEAWGLGADGLSIYVFGRAGYAHFYKYNAQSDTLTTQSARYDYAGDTLGNAIIIAQETATAGVTRDVCVTAIGDRGDEVSEIVAITPNRYVSAIPTNTEGDDGPTYVDNVLIEYRASSTAEWTTVFEESFDTYTVDAAFPPAGDANWSFAGTAGKTNNTTVTFFDEEHGAVLRLDPFGVFTQEQAAAKLTLPEEYSAGRLRVSWDQWREDLTDTFDLSLSDAYGMEQSDVNKYAVGTGTTPDRARTAPEPPSGSTIKSLTAAQWQRCEVFIDYIDNKFDMFVDETNDGDDPPALAGNEETPAAIGTACFRLTAATRVAEWTAPVNAAAARFATNEPEFAEDYGVPLGLSMSPLGDLYYMETDYAPLSVQRRLTRLRLVVTGPEFICGDANCDGSINAFDIDPFVQALVNADVYAASYPDCDSSVTCDVNSDGAVNAFDIDVFIRTLIKGACSTPGE